MGREPLSLIRWRSIVACAVVGLLLAVLSVPASAVVHEQRGTSLHQYTPTIDVYVEHADYFLVTSLRETPGMGMWFTVYEPLPEGSSVKNSLLYSGQPLAAVDPRPAFARAGFTGQMRTVGVIRHGFPFQAAQGRLVTTRGPTGWSGGISAEEWFWAPHIRGRWVHIPLRPLWWGLLANATLYAGLAMALAWAWQRWRWSRGPGLGCCAACGYDLTGIEGVCPECGTQRDRPLETTA